MNHRSFVSLASLLLIPGSCFAVNSGEFNGYDNLRPSSLKPILAVSLPHNPFQPAVPASAVLARVEEPERINESLLLRSVLDNLQGVLRGREGRFSLLLRGVLCVQGRALPASVLGAAHHDFIFLGVEKDQILLVPLSASGVLRDTQILRLTLPVQFQTR